MNIKVRKRIIFLCVMMGMILLMKPEDVKASQTTNLVFDKTYRHTLESVYDSYGKDADTYIFSVNMKARIYSRFKFQEDTEYYLKLYKIQDDGNISLWSQTNFYTYSQTLDGYATLYTLFMRISKGNYCIKIQADNMVAYDYPYELTVFYKEEGSEAETEPNDSASTATNLSLNKTITGNIDSEWDEDYYKITVPQKGKYSIQFTHCKGYDYFVDMYYLSKSGELEHYDEIKIWDTSDEDTDLVTEKGNTSVIKKGTYYLRVRPWEDFGHRSTSYDYKLKFVYKTSGGIKIAKTKGVKGTRKNKKRMRIRWKSVGGNVSYQVIYAPNKKFKNQKVKYTKKTSIVLKKLKKKPYYVKVRAYKYDSSGKKYVYGAFSKVIRVKKR